MRISPIYSNYQLKDPYLSQDCKFKRVKYQQITSNPSFCATKTSGKKFFGGLFGGLAFISAAVGSAVLSGGLSLPFIAAYTAIGTAAGVGIGHVTDKSENIKDSENENS